jgi:uncharacterized protein YbjT (DUF2867 family)
MPGKILVTGGTGNLGRHTVPLLQQAGAELRVLSRSARENADGIEYVTGDLLRNEGVEAAVDGVDVVLHLAGANKGDDEATANLARAAARAGVRHLVYVSVIGADQVPVGWLRMKRAAEQAVTGSGVPWTILRPAQFHDLVLTVAEKMAKMPVVPAPGAVRMEPVDVRDVAQRLAELALGEPAGLVPDLAGPKVDPMAELVRSYLEVRGKRRPRLPLPMP